MVDPLDSSQRGSNALVFLAHASEGVPVAMLLPITRMQDRLALAKADSDVAAFWDLMFFGELIIKLSVAGLGAAISDDRDRHRYRLHYRLARADGIGDWAEALDELLLGPTSQYLAAAARTEQKQLTQLMPPSTWSYEAIAGLHSCCRQMDIEVPPLSPRLPLRQWYSLFAFFRNKTRGHGAPAARQCSAVCESLEASLALMISNLQIFGRPWAHLHRSLSGKYRVTHWGGDKSPFEPLKRGAEFTYPDGVYVVFDGLHKTDLIHSDADASDFYFANGQFNGKTFELLSYATNNRMAAPCDPYLAPIEVLPDSETQGRGQLMALGNCFTNIPPMPIGYVHRPELEKELMGQLLSDNHTVVSLAGPGGTGKTSLALQVLHDIAAQQIVRYDALIWFSARDIDLTSTGPKPVRPHLLSVSDFAEEYVRLVEPAGARDRSFRPLQHFAEALRATPIGPCVFVFDNFETVINPVEVYQWIDTYCRPPNKVLITTRKRDFKADYPVFVGGMTHPEAEELICKSAAALGIGGLITADYMSLLIDEASGHPYVMKILLGEVAKRKALVKPERIVATQDDILRALFERTFVSLSPSAQRVFLLLCNWRSAVPEVVLEAVLLRPANERMDVIGAIQELQQASLIDEVRSDRDNEKFVTVPLAALVFGQAKITASPQKALIQADSELLQTIGASGKHDIRHGVMPRIQRLLRSVSERSARDPDALHEMRPLLEFVARRIPAVWLAMADIYEQDGSMRGLEQAKECLRRYLENPAEGSRIANTWGRVAQLCFRTGDVRAELHAWAEMAQSPEATTDQVSLAALRMNSLLQEEKHRGHGTISQDERTILVRQVALAMEARIVNLDATDLSRLAWLHLHLGNIDRATEVATKGHTMSPNNIYCIQLLARLD